jgi:hypothetical protein
LHRSEDVLNRLETASASAKRPLAFFAKAAMEALRLKESEEPGSKRGTARPKGTLARSVSVIVPVRPGAPEPRALEAFEHISCLYRPLEVILSRGECPSRQRNVAAQKARGDILIFLDDDSSPSPDLIDVYLQAFGREPDLSAVGGPAVYSSMSFPKRLSAALLSEPLVTGRSASRYSPRGLSRRCDERELILANLAVRRSAFDN